MISLEVIGTHALPFTIVVLVAELVVWLCISGDYPRERGAARKGVLLRIKGYAILKKEGCKSVNQIYEGILPAGEHEVVLGTLKKVEQKNAVLVSILIFALAVLVSLSYSESLSASQQCFFVVLLTGLIPPFCVAFSGFVQLDQRDFRLMCVRSDEKVAASRLQDALLSDLMRKEHAFRFSFWCVRALVVVFLIMISIDKLF